MAQFKREGVVALVNEMRRTGNYEGLPKATLENVVDVQTEIAKNPRMVNDLIETMFNKIVGTYINHPTFSNPLKRFKLETQRFGDTIEEVYVGIAEEKTYDADHKGEGKNLLSTEEAKIKAAYHQVNREAQFKGTVLQKEMVRALTEPGGLERLVSGIINSLTTGNEINEYRYMKSLIDSAYKFGDLYLVEVGDLSDPNNKFAQKARQYALDVPFPNRFNAAGVENAKPIESMTVILSNETRSIFDTQTLAGAFNMDKTDLMGSQINIDRFQDPNLLAVIVENNFFVVQDKMPAQMSSQFFGDSLKTNYWLTVDQIISRSPFATAIAFVKEIPADMKYKLQLSKDAVVLDDIDRKSQDITTKLVGFDALDGLPDLNDYTVKVETGVNSIVEHTVDENGVITLTLKDGIHPGAKETVQVVVTDAEDAEVSFTKNILVQKSSKVFLED